MVGQLSTFSNVSNSSYCSMAMRVAIFTSLSRFRSIPPEVRFAGSGHQCAKHADLCLGTKSLGYVGKRGLLSIADLHASDTEKSTLRRGFSYVLANSLQPSLKRIRVLWCLGRGSRTLLSNSPANAERRPQVWQHQQDAGAVLPLRRFFLPLFRNLRRQL